MRSRGSGWRHCRALRPAGQDRAGFLHVSPEPLAPAGRTNAGVDPGITRGEVCVRMGAMADPWTPPIWLRKLRTVADEQRSMANASMSPTERFHLAGELMAFALKRLEEQAERRGCSIGQLLLMYERADAHLRVRG